MSNDNHQSTENDFSWDDEIARLVAADGTQSLSLRERLVGLDLSRVVKELGAVVNAESASPSDRLKAAWLLKDLSNAAAAPFLVAGLSSPSATRELREQILDTLERMAFAACLPPMDYRQVVRVLAGRSEIAKFIALLATVGTTETTDLLREYSRDPEIRLEVLTDLTSRPAGWIDAFLTTLLLDSGGSPEVQMAIEEREYRRLRDGLRVPGSHESVSADAVGRLLGRREMSLVRSLVEQGRLDPGAAEVARGMTDDGLSKSQRKLLAQIKDLLTRQ
jgi:hypothetical protein